MRLIVVLTVLSIASSLTSAPSRSAEPHAMDWNQLPPIPNSEGFAGSFAGVSGGALIVAGGANIPGDVWADQFVKKWYDSVFVLAKPDGAWKSGFKLPRPLGYGVSITAEDSLICIGGSNETGHFADAFRLRWKDGAIHVSEFPKLPKPCANACGALVGRTIYVAGGIAAPAATQALHTFWALDLDNLALGWNEVPPWPGPERMLAVAGSLDGAFYLFSGAKLLADAGEKPVREYLRDAYCFTPGKGWKRLADLPRSAVAAASPAPEIDPARLIIISGDDGKNVAFEPVEAHPGFPRSALIYNAPSNEWSVNDGVPFSRATVPAVRWGDGFTIPNGEVRPRVRTPEVWWLRAR